MHRGSHAVLHEVNEKNQPQGGLVRNPGGQYAYGSYAETTPRHALRLTITTLVKLTRDSNSFSPSRAPAPLPGKVSAGGNWGFLHVRPAYRS